MRPLLLAATAAMLTPTLVAHADTLSETFTVNGPSVQNSTSGYEVVTSSSFSQFSPSLGILNSVMIALSGTYSGVAGFLIFENGVSPVNDPKQILVPSQGEGFGSLSFSVNGTDTSDLGLFEGAGSEALFLDFSDSPAGTSTAAGTLTYNYTPTAVAATPEPSSVALLGTGMLGLAGMMRKRYASMR